MKKLPQSNWLRALVIQLSLKYFIRSQACYLSRVELELIGGKTVQDAEAVSFSLFDNIAVFNASILIQKLIKGCL